VAGDEVYGGDPKLRESLEDRGIGYVLAVACGHNVRTHVGKIRADDAPGSLHARTNAISPCGGHHTDFAPNASDQQATGGNRGAAD